MGQGDRTAMVLGGSGLVGYQVARNLAGKTEIEELTLVARFQGETADAVQKLRREFPRLKVRGYHGDLFLPGRPTPVGEDDARQPHRRDPALRKRLFQDTYRDFDAAYRDSFLAQLLTRERPDVIVDCVNTATGISYQDVFTSCQAVQADLDAGEKGSSELREDVEKLMVSISIPQLILHIRILNRGLVESGARLYLKVGTTGTGGMGLNIPYTHGEERPSPQLLNKTAIAFAHTGMLFLMARTPGGPIIKEVKPAALIGYRGVDFRAAVGKQFHRREEEGRIDFELSEASEPYVLYRARRVKLGKTLDLTPDASSYETLPGPDGSGVVKVPLVDTGENGLFTKGEFEAITSLDQMEYITPEEIADVVLLEVRGVGTGRDVVSAIDSSVLGSTYKAGLLRGAALEMLERLEEEHGVPSIALGRLGPPGLAKVLFEAYLFRRVFGSLDAVLAAGRDPKAAETLSARLFAALEEDPLLTSLATSVGIPVLCPDGETLLRGPFVSAPPYRKFRSEVEITPESLDAYSATWVDLRPRRVAWWLETFRHMEASRSTRDRHGWATARVNRTTYLSERIEIGSVVAWILGNQDEGFRMI